DGKVCKSKVPMLDGRFDDGTAQPLYFPPNDPRGPEGIFKGMAVILEERKCKDPSKFTKDQIDCCCQRILYTQPDFVGVESLLETLCKMRGYQVLFLPKFHCELNFIEQCWGFAKRLYHQFPTSSKEVDLERNVLAALDSVPLITIFATRSRRFMDAYLKGLSGKQAAWASKKYRGHRVLPESLMDDMDKANIL
ncbi:hypothetical protein PAXRUDRAFT_136944, partial [Paxillus rubicundulus Ve08.2h10]